MPLTRGTPTGGINKKSQKLRLPAKSVLKISNDKKLAVGVKAPSVLRRMREEKNLSQQKLAKRMRISRYRLHWMENKSPEKLNLKDAVLFAGALEFSFPIFMGMVGLGSVSPQISRYVMDLPASSVKFEEGIELDCLLDHPKGSFVGRLNLAPQKSFSLKKLSGEVKFVFSTIVQGVACIQGFQEPMVLKEREGFHADQGIQLEIYNPQPVQKLSLLLFIQRS